jgi:phosphopantothenoylcysteine decarboxylase/phosphopantothenate--cysteine ligase
VASVLQGVCGGVAAYKACELTRLLVKAGHDVTPVLTREAERFVGVHTFEALARRESPKDIYPHLLRADLYVIAPLSANTLAKLANGLADNVVTQLALAFPGPILAAPAMNTRMWEHPATRANTERVRAHGVELVGPQVGELAEGEVGAGRMSEPEAIFARCEQLLVGRTDDLAGKRVVVSAGGTQEPFDSVRYLGNRSSGRMGVALAEAARRRGADVTLVYANGTAPPPGGVEVVDAPTAADLARELFARADADVVVMAAAVADYRPANPENGKRTKNDESWTVTLEPTQDVLRELGRRRRPGQVLVGFAADEGDPGLERARAKLANKGATLFVYNDVSRDDIGFDSEDNEVVILSPRGERSVGKRRKEAVAEAILDEVAALLEGA